MKPTKQLIRGLRETAQRLRGDAKYAWADAAQCNCGLLAQTLLDVDATGLRKRLNGIFGSWASMAREDLYCPQTGLPMNEVSRALEAVGFERQDYHRVEITDHRNYKDRYAVAAWMDAEADKLEARRAAGERPERTP